jgi:hypothetical protein
VEQSVLAFQAPAFADIEDPAGVDVFHERALAHAQLGAGFLDRQ